MTWPELIAVELAAHDGTAVMIRDWEPVRCAGCEQWACVAVPCGLPVWCLSCWAQLQFALQRAREEGPT